MTIIERVGDQYRAWSTVADCYYSAPVTRDEMAAELRAWGWTEANIARRLDTAEVREQWARSAEEQDAELLGCEPDEVSYFGSAAKVVK
jgi:hypothetical protein